MRYKKSKEYNKGYEDGKKDIIRFIRICLDSVRGAYLRGKTA